VGYSHITATQTRAKTPKTPKMTQFTAKTPNTKTKKGF
jgi:hypothetical protein